MDHGSEGSIDQVSMVVSEDRRIAMTLPEDVSPNGRRFFDEKTTAQADDPHSNCWRFSDFDTINPIFFDCDSMYFTRCRHRRRVSHDPRFYNHSYLGGHKEWADTTSILFNTA